MYSEKVNNSIEVYNSEKEEKNKIRFVQPYKLRFYDIIKESYIIAIDCLVKLGKNFIIPYRFTYCLLNYKYLLTYIHVPKLTTKHR